MKVRAGAWKLSGNACETSLVRPPAQSLSKSFLRSLRSFAAITLLWFSRLFRLGNDSHVRLRCLPAVWIFLFGFLV
jgi:hypothetical protein